jgi:UDP-glucose 4-epimerase
MRCLVTGGGGFLGSHLVERLVADGHAVRVLDIRPAQQSTPSGVEWLEGDFSHREVGAHAVAGCEAMFHLASTTIPKTATDDPVFDVNTNIAGSIGLLQAAVKHGVKRVLFLSSGGTVYGIPKSVPIPETHATNPVSAYGISKLAIEKYFGMFHHLHGLPYCILRLANPFGPRQRPEGAQGVVTAFVAHVVRGEELPIWGDGSVVRDYLYVADSVDAIARALDSSHCGVVNVGAGAGLSLNEVIERIEGTLGKKARRKYLPGRAFDVPANVLDNRLAAEILGWKPRTSFEQGVRDTADYFEALDRGHGTH